MDVNPTITTTLPKRLCGVVRAMHCMTRKGVSKGRQLMVHLHLLLKHGKIAGKALGNLVFHHYHQHHSQQHRNHDNQYSTFSYSPCAGDVEFSCSSTPSFPSSPVAKRGKKRGHCDLNAAAIRKAFEIQKSSPFHEADDVRSVVASPSPLPAFWNHGKNTPANVRQVRITDSPFPLMEEEGDDDGRVDAEAEAFIARFYQQLRQQQGKTAMMEATGFYR